MWRERGGWKYEHGQTHRHTKCQMGWTDTRADSVTGKDEWRQRERWVEGDNERTESGTERPTKRHIETDRIQRQTDRQTDK